MLTPVACNVFDRAELSLHFHARGDVERIQGAQADSGTMSPDQNSGLNQNRGSQLNSMHPVEDRVQRFLGGRKARRHSSRLRGQSGLAFHS